MDGLSNESDEHTQFMLRNRKEAGKLLAEKLKVIDTRGALVLAIPRGGVVVGYEIAKAIRGELDIITPRKLGDPFNPELAIGAVMQDGSTFLNEGVIAIRGVLHSQIEAEKKAQIAESKRRMDSYRGSRPYPAIKGRIVILVDDGIATGATMIVASRWLRKSGAKKIVIAVPVLPEEMVPVLMNEADKIVYINAPRIFYAIGQFYKEFMPVEDKEVIKLLKDYWKS